MTLEKPQTAVGTVLPVPRASARTVLPVPRASARNVRLAGWVAGTLLLAAGLLLPAGRSNAEPYMAVREGYKCSQCHVNKTGGGARNDYANVYLQTRMAAHSGFGSEDSTTGAGTGHVANNLSVGADVRASLTYSKFNNQHGTATFGQEAACTSCHKGSSNGVGEAGGGKVAEAFMRYQPIPDVASIVYSVNAMPTLATRDFYGLVESVIPGSGYVKAGTFKLPNGLNNTWDVPFQHVTPSQSGSNGYQGLIGFETVYATGVEFGFEPGPFSFSLSATNPDDLTKNLTEKRYFFTASAVGRVGMIGVNYATDPLSLTQTRTLASGFFGTSLGRVTLLGQVDRIDDTGKGLATVSQEARLGEVDLLVAKGHNLKYMIEYRDPDLSLPKNTRDRESFIYETFMTPFLQLRLGYRLYNGPKNAAGNTNNPAIQGEQWFGEAHFVF